MIKIAPAGKCLFIAIVLSWLFLLPLSASYIREMPYTITQPDGKIIECYTSGDEYHNWLHDKEGYTIIRNPKTGYYTYAVQDGEGVKAGDWVVGRDDDRRFTLNPKINISERLYKQRRAELTAFDVPGRAPHTGTLNNIVIFIRFADQDEYNQPISLYEGWHNTDAGSMKNYFLETSYGALTVNSTFYPAAVGGMVVSWQDSHPRGYYCPYDSIFNTIGYENSTICREREEALLAAATNAVSASVPAGLDIDGDDDNAVDNVTYIVAGGTTAWATLLWPHRTGFWWTEVYINGKQVLDYNLQVQNHLTGSSVGVLAHEFFHTLGAPDLYHYADNSTYSPAYQWDIMDANSNPPQHMSAFMKWKYAGWISEPEIPIITTQQLYTLNPSGTHKNAYRILSPYSTTEYFLVEYRRKTGTFENSLPGSGLLVWRIKTDCGNGNADGPPDEVYVYRPNGSVTAEGSPSLAHFSLESGRTFIDDTSNPSPFLSDGTPGGLAINSIGSAGTTISFALGTPAGAIIDFSTNPYIQEFDTTDCPPEYWFTNIVYGSTGFTHTTSSSYPSAQPQSGIRMLKYASYSASAGHYALMVTPRIDLSNYDTYDYNLSFWMYRDSELPDAPDKIEVFLNTAPSLNGSPVNLLTIYRSITQSPAVGFSGWYQYKCSLNPPAPGFYFIVFKATSGAGNNIYLDNFQLSRTVFPTSLSKWMGTTSVIWSVASNWRNGWIPDASKDVLIPVGVPNMPKLMGITGTCNNLTMESGTSLMFQLGTLNVLGDASIDGTLNMSSGECLLSVDGDLTLNSSSAISGNGTKKISVKGDLTVNHPVEFDFPGTLEFSGSSASNIISNCQRISLYYLEIEKTNAVTYLSVPANGYFIVDMSTTVASTATFVTQPGIYYYVNDENLTCEGNLQMNGGILTLRDYMAMLTLGTNSYLNSVIVQNGCVAMFQSDAVINGTLDFADGSINIRNRNITIGKYWVSESPDDCVYSGSTVTFSGTADQNCYNTNFYKLYINKPSGKFIVPQNSSVGATLYQLISGSVEVNGGNLIVGSQVSNVNGAYNLNGGEFSINFSTAQTININAVLNITNGNFNITGGTSSGCTWADTSPMSLTMSGGSLNFTDNGLNLLGTGYAINTNITGGTIRIAKDVQIYRTINWGNAVMELNTYYDASVFSVAGSPFPTFVINKFYTRSENVSLIGNVTFANDLTIQAGTLTLGSGTCTVNGDLDIYGNLACSYASSQLNVTGNLTYYSGSSAAIADGNTNCQNSFVVQSGATVSYAAAATLYMKSADASLNILAAGTQLGELFVAGTSGTDSLTIVPGSISPLVLNGNLTVNSGNTFDLANAGLTIAGNLTLNGRLNTYARTVEITGYPIFSATSVLVMSGGIFRWFDSTSPYSTTLLGNLTLGTGSFTAVNHKLIFGTGLTLAVTNYRINCAGFEVPSASVFTPTTGRVTITGHPSGQPSPISLATGNNFYDLYINSSTGARLESTPIQCNGTVFCSAGRLDLNGKNLKVNRGVTVGRNGILEVDSGAFLQLASAQTLAVDSGGVLQCIGDQVTPAQVGSISSFITYQINSGATIAAEYCTFKNMNANGVQVLSGAIVDANNSFRNCTFRDGVTGTLMAPSCFLTLNNNQIITIVGANFATTLGTYGKNIRKTVDLGEVFMIDATGVFAGETLDADIYERVHWGALPPVDSLSIVRLPNGDAYIDWSYPFTPTGFNIYSSTEGDFTPGPQYLYDSVSGTQSWFSEPATSPCRLYKITAEY